MATLPGEFVRLTRHVMGEERFERFLHAFEEDTPVSIRLNPMKLERGQWEVIGGERVPWCSEGFYLPQRPNFTMDPLLHAGCYYVQEASSMFLEHALTTLLSARRAPTRALDLCAAPGGKTTLLRTLLPEDCTLTSNEPVRGRCQVLKENVLKWGYANHTVTNLYPRDFRKAKARFDVILCDVPCSGEGMFRKDAATIGEWSPQNVERCWRLQRDIVSEAWHCLNDGGLLIYSTCTLNTKENEENVRWFVEELGAKVLPVSDVKPEWNITGSLLEGFTEPVYRFIPGITRGEGLFLCALHKTGSGESGMKKGYGKRLHDATKDIIPPTIAEVELSYPQAISYLRREALVLPDAPLGLLTVTFLGQPLGQVKNIGTRANNLYPKEWRIKTTHIPNEYEAILRHSEPHPDGRHREG